MLMKPIERQIALLREIQQWRFILDLLPYPTSIPQRQQWERDINEEMVRLLRRVSKKRGGT